MESEVIISLAITLAFGILIGFIMWKYINTEEYSSIDLKKRSRLEDISKERDKLFDDVMAKRAKEAREKEGGVMVDLDNLVKAHKSYDKNFETFGRTGIIDNI